MLIIKRYPNRKLYDTEAKRYVTLEGIAELIQSGEELSVIDHETGEDLTTVTLSQIIFEQEKKRSGFLPRSILSNLIRTGSGTLDYLWRSFQASTGALRLLEQEINHRLDALVERGEMDGPQADRMRAELVRSSQIDPQHLQDYVESLLHSLNLPTQTEVRRLEAQIEELNGQIESLLEAYDAKKGKILAENSTGTQANQS